MCDIITHVSEKPWHWKLIVWLLSRLSVDAKRVLILYAVLYPQYGEESVKWIKNYMRTRGVFIAQTFLPDEWWTKVLLFVEQPNLASERRRCMRMLDIEKTVEKLPKWLRYAGQYHTASEIDYMIKKLDMT